VTFTDGSTGVPTSWSWSFPGGTPSTSTLPNPTVTYSSAGTYSATLTVTNAGGNNTFTFVNCITTLGTALPLVENFESGIFPPTGYSLTDPNADQNKWALKSGTGGFGNSTNCMWFNNYGINSNGAADGLITPKITLTGLISAWLSFDVAYAVYSSSYKDSLRILASTDCGTNWNQVYLKSQTALATVTGNVTSSWTPTAAQWRRDSVNLSSYIGVGSMLFNFQNIGRYGNNIYIDNISITGTPIPTYTNLSVKCYIQGLYQASGIMISPLYNNGLTSDPSNADSVLVELHAATSPYAMITSQQVVIRTNGTASLLFPSALAGASYYVVVKHRNSIETWSKIPVLFSSSGTTSVNFTTP
jgi:PKD repeat protein